MITTGRISLPIWPMVMSITSVIVMRRSSTSPRTWRTTVVSTPRHKQRTTRTPSLTKFPTSIRRTSLALASSAFAWTVNSWGTRRRPVTVTENEEGIMILFIIALYFLPTIITACNHHRSTLANILVNLFLGWTGIGWLVALIWSIVAPTPPPAPVIIYNNNGSGTQHATRPLEPFEVQQPSPVRQLADRIHEAMIPPPNTTGNAGQRD